MNKQFKIQSQYPPAGDQPSAIKPLIDGLSDGEVHQSLLGVTGSGKTFTIANVILETQHPAMIMAPNKTLASQLYGEIKKFFSENSVDISFLTMIIINPKLMCLPLIHLSTKTLH